MSYYGAPPGQPQGQDQGDPYLGQPPAGYEAPVDPYAQAPADPYGQAPADPYAPPPPESYAPADPYAQGRPPPGWLPHDGRWQQPPVQERDGDSNIGAVLVGLFLVLIGAWFLFRDEIALDFGQLWPALAVGLGIVMVLAAFVPRRRRR